MRKKIWQLLSRDCLPKDSLHLVPIFFQINEYFERSGPGFYELSPGRGYMSDLS